MSDDVTPIARTTVGAPLERIKPPTSIDLPELPPRPVTIHVEIDDEDGCRVQHDVELRREHADDERRLAAALVRGIVEVGSSYAASTAAPHNGATAAQDLREAIAARAGEL